MPAEIRWRAAALAAKRNALCVQRWLGQHSAAFALATYVHLLDDDLGEPLTLGVAPTREDGTTTELEVAA